MTLIVAGILSFITDSGDESRESLVITMYSLFGVGAMSLRLAFLMPSLELLPPGGISRLKRFRGRVIAFGLAVAGSVVAGAILVISGS